MGLATIDYETKSILERIAVALEKIASNASSIQQLEETRKLEDSLIDWDRDDLEFQD